MMRVLVKQKEPDPYTNQPESRNVVSAKVLSTPVAIRREENAQINVMTHVHVVV